MNYDKSYESDQNRDRTTRREHLQLLATGGLGVAALIGIGLLSGCGESAEDGSEPLSWKEERKLKNEEIRREAEQMLRGKGVWGEIPLTDLKDVSHLALSGDFTFGSGEITEDRVEVYNFSWTPLVEGSNTLQSELPNQLFAFNVIEQDPENPIPQASIRFGFDIDKFVKKSRASTEQLTGVRDYGDDPEAYINPELFEDGEKVVVTLTEEQYKILRETGVVSF